MEIASVSGQTDRQTQFVLFHSVYWHTLLLLIRCVDSVVVKILPLCTTTTQEQLNSAQQFPLY